MPKAPLLTGITCESCDQPATRITRDSGDAQCAPCIRDHYCDPDDAATRLTAGAVRRYDYQGRYGA